MSQVSAARVVAGATVTGPALVEFDGERIGTVHDYAGVPAFDWLVPGYVDLQVNGVGDIDVASASGNDWEVLDARLAARGVTTWCPTLISAPLDRYSLRLAEIARAARRGGARPHIAGAHLEGPFLGGAAGAHPREMLAAIDPAWLAALPPIVALITLAPELDGALDAIEALTHRSVLVAIGHTTATGSTVFEAADRGARLVTHLFNAMSGMHHRLPGVVGAALADDRLSCSLIGDGVHVDPIVLKVAVRALGADRAVLVSDEVAYDGPPVDAARLTDGTLAGATVGLDAGVRTLVARAGVAPEIAVGAASTNPARLLGLDDRGTVAPGQRADLVALDAALDVVAVWIGGEQVRG